MAIEDAASISQLLPGGTPASDVPKRLKLYEDIRHERVTWVQEQTRINALDEDKRPASKSRSWKAMLPVDAATDNYHSKGWLRYVGILP